MQVYLMRYDFGKYGLVWARVPLTCSQRLAHRGDSAMALDTAAWAGWVAEGLFPFMTISVELDHWYKRASGSTDSCSWIAGCTSQAKRLYSWRTVSDKESIGEGYIRCEALVTGKTIMRGMVEEEGKKVPILNGAILEHEHEVLGREYKKGPQEDELIDPTAYGLAEPSANLSRWWPHEH